MDDDGYHQRWMSETGFSLLKEGDGDKLRSRSWHGQFRELTRKCIVHNLSQAAIATRRLLSFSSVLVRGIAVVTEISLRMRFSNYSMNVISDSCYIF